MTFHDAVRAIEARNRANAVFQMSVGGIVSAHRAIPGSDPEEILTSLEVEIEKLEAEISQIETVD